ncbi:MAG TPA: oligosaccharide flippase family protein [Candidatus Saccharimonadales bacterium]|nr:oligosaccharide flippase family protein [Candidatus Saccharimonadales bacterium]
MNIVSMLSIAELGVGAAITYHLYRPIAKNDYVRVGSLLALCRRWYRFSALAIFVVGIAILPFIHSIVGEHSIDGNVYLIFLMFIVNMMSTYLIAYKRIVLLADQKSYVLNIVHTLFLVIGNGVQIWSLLAAHNYYLYLALLISMQLLENIYISYRVRRDYPLLHRKVYGAVDRKTKKEIVSKIKGLAYHNVGSFAVFGTDSILISTFLGIKMVGLYANYYMVFTAISGIMSRAFTAITATIGDLLIEGSRSKTIDVYNKLHLFNYWATCVAVTGFLVTISPFVSVWIGDEYVLDMGVVVALSVNLYLQLSRSILNSFKSAGGIFYEDRFVPIIESIINLLLSIILLHFMGLVGVLLGTICSTLVLFIYSYPRFVFVGILHKSYHEYYAQFIRDFFVFAAMASASWALTASVGPEGGVLRLLVNTMIAFVLSNFLLYVIFGRTAEFKYLRDLVNTGIRNAVRHRSRL